jgi:hypothetical protein
MVIATASIVQMRVGPFVGFLDQPFLEHSVDGAVSAPEPSSLRCASEFRARGRSRGVHPPPYVDTARPPLILRRVQTHGLASAAGCRRPAWPTVSRLAAYDGDAIARGRRTRSRRRTNYGHLSRRMFEHYSHIRLSAKKAALDRLEQSGKTPLLKNVK